MGESRRTRLLAVLLAGAVASMAPAACGGGAPATMTAETTATVVPTDVPIPASTMAPTPVTTTGPADGQTPGPITWDIREAPYRVSEVVSTGPMLVAVGTAGSTADSGDVAGVWTSPDGQTWEPAMVTQPAGTMAAVAAGPGRLVAVGTVEDGTSGPAAWTSVDGQTWQALPGLGVRRFLRPRAGTARGHRRRTRWLRRRRLGDRGRWPSRDGLVLAGRTGLDAHPV